MSKLRNEDIIGTKEWRDKMTNHFVEMMITIGALDKSCRNLDIEEKRRIEDEFSKKALTALTKFHKVLV